MMPSNLKKSVKFIDPSHFDDLGLNQGFNRTDGFNGHQPSNPPPKLKFQDNYLMQNYNDDDGDIFKPDE